MQGQGCYYYNSHCSSTNILISKKIWFTHNDVKYCCGRKLSIIVTKMKSIMLWNIIIQLHVKSQLNSTTNKNLLKHLNSSVEFDVHRISSAYVMCSEITYYTESNCLIRGYKAWNVSWTLTVWYFGLLQNEFTWRVKLHSKH